MAISTYAELSAAIGTWGQRTYTMAKTDDFIALSEARFNRVLGSNYRRKTTATITTDSNGEGTIPSDCVNLVSMTRDVLGSIPLKQVSWNALIARNPYEDADDAQVFAVRGTVVRVSPVTTDNFNAVYWAKLTGLSASNTTNWLLTLAPDVYLAMCAAMARAFEEEWEQAAVYESKAVGYLSELMSQANVAEYGDVEMTLPQAP